MKLRVALVSLAAAAGFAASFALASPPPGKGKPKQGSSTSASTSASTSTATITNAKKTLICHKTHSAKKPYVLIRVSTKAVDSHLRHGDVLPTDGKCPAAAPPTSTTTTTSGP